MPPMGFEPTISAGERPKTYALDRAFTGPANICRVERIHARRADPTSTLPVPKLT